jgi:hypothetical protein
MGQHAAHDAGGPRPMARDQRHVVIEQPNQFHLVRVVVGDDLGHLFDQTFRYLGKIIDEIQWVLNFMRDAGGELAEGGHLLALHQSRLRLAQLVQRPRGLVPGRLGLVIGFGIGDRDRAITAERAKDQPLAFAKSAPTVALHAHDAERLAIDDQRREQRGQHVSSTGHVVLVLLVGRALHHDLPPLA